MLWLVAVTTNTQNIQAVQHTGMGHCSTCFALVDGREWVLDVEPFLWWIVLWGRLLIWDNCERMVHIRAPSLTDLLTYLFNGSKAKLLLCWFTLFFTGANDLSLFSFDLLNLNRWTELVIVKLYTPLASFSRRSSSFLFNLSIFFLAFFSRFSSNLRS